jgi:hypothetical protein
MARLSQYPKDTTPNKLDSFLTLDSSTGNTTRIDISDIAGVVADQNLLETPDSALYLYTTPNNLNYSIPQSGVLVLNPEGTNATRLFSTLTQIVVSKSGFNAKNISTYLNDLVGYQIKISKLGDLNVFGIFEVTNVTDYTDHYIKLNLLYKERGSGSISYGDKFYVSHHQTSFDNDFSDNSVTEFGDVYNAGSGYIITADERNRVNEVTSKIFYSDIIDDVLSNRADRPLSANQGLILKQYIDNINTLLLSDNVDLNSLQEVVDFIEANKTTLDTLTIGNIAGLQTALDSKVDKVTGKALSENDFTDAYRSKLDGIQAAAEVNVQADYTETDPVSDAFIQNKPTDVTDLSLHSVTELNDISAVGSGSIITDTERNQLQGLIPNSSDDVAAIGDIITGKAITFQGPVSEEPIYDNAIYVETEDTVSSLRFKNHGHVVKMDDIVQNLSTGIISGGAITITSATDISIEIGSGVILDLNKETLADEPHPVLKRVNWTQQFLTIGNLEPLDPSQRNAYIYIDENGLIQQQYLPFSDAQYKTIIVLGAVLHASGVVVDSRLFPNTAYGQQLQFGEFARLFGPLKKEGFTVTPNPGTLSINRSSGTAFAYGRNYGSDPNNPSLVTDIGKSNCVIHRYYRDGSGGFVRDTNNGAGYTTLDPNSWDDGSGVLQVAGVNKITTQRLFYFPNNPDLIIAYYGVTEFQSLDDANNQLNSEPFSEAPNTASQAIFLGYVIMDHQVTDLSDIANARIVQAGLFRSVSFSATGAAATAANLSDLNDIGILSPQEGQVLQYNSTGFNWVNQTLPDFNAQAVAYSIALS